MTRLPRLTGKEVISTLRKLGFALVRVKGSHHFMRHPDGQVTIVPVHRGEIIGPGLMTKILNDCELTAEDLRAEL